MLVKLSQWIATVFYLGYFPFAAGSLASLLGGGLAVVLQKNSIIYFGVLAVLSVLGWYCSAVVEKQENKKDPPCVVIDEVVGGMIAFWGLPLNWPIAITAFFVFRAFDMFKIAPAYQLQHQPHGVGIMLDDIIAGMYTCLIMHLARWLAISLVLSFHTTS